jgi:hypothetical protein
MWRNASAFVAVFIIFAITLTLSPDAVWADIGQIKTLKGDVRIVRAERTMPARAGDSLEQADTLITGTNGSVGMTFIDGTRFSTGPDSVLELSRFRFDPTTHEGDFQASVKKGTLAIISGQIAKASPTAMTVRTPASILGVRGTRFLIKVGDEDQAQ